jgi:formylglycine-generating enzyme required for sulfatase activity
VTKWSIALLRFAIFVLLGIILGGVAACIRPSAVASMTVPAGPGDLIPVSRPASRPATQSADAEAVAELIHLLESDSLAVREEATHKLIGMGICVNRLLEAKLRERNLAPEVAVRINAVLDDMTGWPFDANEAAMRQEKAAHDLGIPVAISLDLGNQVTMKLALIPAGKFLMGSPVDEKGHFKNESPRHVVAITKPFYMSVHPVTQQQYEQVMGENPSDFKGEQNPVETVSWGEALEFCKRVSRKTGKRVSLPTEAQWEYACRAGSKTRFSYGDDDDYARLDDYAWYDKNCDNRPHPVGQKKPNAWGLFDMHGGVLQWCSDWFAPYANERSQDPEGPDSGKTRVLRGGCWCYGSVACRAAIRGGNSPYDRYRIMGFRVSADLKEHSAPNP